MNPLAIFGEVRTQLKSIKERYEKYQEGQGRFQSLQGGLDRLISDISEVEGLLRAFPSAFPEAIVPLFNGTLEYVHSNFKDENATMPTRLENAFVESSSSYCSSCNSKS